MADSRLQLWWGAQAGHWGKETVKPINMHVSIIIEHDLVKFTDKIHVTIMSDH